MTFGQPMFLWALGAVLIPLIIHLINLQRHRRVYFSNVARLGEMQTQQRRRSRLREWLILASRMLAVAFLVLAFAQPRWRSDDNGLATDGAVVSLYVDNSFSMEQATAEGSVLDQAVARARQIAAAYPVDTRYQLITGDMTGGQMRLLDRDELLSALGDVRPTPAGPLMSKVVARQAAFLSGVNARQRHLYLISDYQCSTADIDRLPVDSSRTIALVPIRGVENDNLYVDTVKFDAPAYVPGGVAKMEITLANGGGHDAEGVPVRVYVDGRERTVQTVDVPAGGTTRCQAAFAVGDGGGMTGVVTVDDHPVTFDDRYYFTLDAGEPMHVLEIDGTSPNKHIGQLFGYDSLVSLTVARALSQSPSDYDLIVLCEAESLSSGEVAELADWVREGGSLLVVPSAAASDLRSTNSLLAALQAPQLGRWSVGETKASQVAFDASLYRGVFASKNNEMEMPVVRGHYSLSASPYRAEPLIALPDGAPLLCVTQADAGRVYLFTSPLRAEWNSLVAQALFVPTLYNMALYARSMPVPAYTLGREEPIALRRRHDLRQGVPEMLTPSGATLMPDVRMTGGKCRLVPHGALQEEGVYVLADEPLAFNYSRKESKMEFYGEEELEKLVGQRSDMIVMPSGSRPLDEVIKERQSGRPLWRLCLVLALAMLASEVLLIKIKQ